MITDKDIEEATFKAGFSFAQSGLDINTAWEKFSEVSEQIKKNAMKHPITGEAYEEPQGLTSEFEQLDNQPIWEK